MELYKLLSQLSVFPATSNVSSAHFTSMTPPHSFTPGAGCTTTIQPYITCSSIHPSIPASIHLEVWVKEAAV